MSIAAMSRGGIKNSWYWFVGGGFVLLICFGIGVPNLMRMRAPAEDVAQFAEIEQRNPAYGLGSRTAALQSAVSKSRSVLEPERKIIRTSSIALEVQHPSQVADKITAIAEALGGYLVSGNSGGEDASSATLTIRVPGERFDDARAEIRKLGIRVEAERIDAEDVSRQYIDQDASLRNLKAEEAQYLAILKQASTVKDMLAVTQRLSEVRGQIEQQQAEFNALSRQIETVAITVSLRAEGEQRVFGLNWRPLYQIKLALRDGLESLANYATAMITVLFYLPAVLLWLVTLSAAGLGAWRLTCWAGTRWFGWKSPETAAAK